jgi:hypothetical protein
VCQQILAFLKTLFYGGNSEQNHLEACSKVDDQLMSRIVLAAKGCCTLVVEIRKRLSNYEAIGASGGLSSPTRESNNSFVESDYSTPESLSMRSGSAVASGTMYGGGVEGGEVEDGDSVISVRVESVSGKQLVDSAAVAVAVSEARIPTVTARELKIDKSNLAGEGSFGKVYPGSYYRAKVAVKVLNASRELFQSPRFWENFNTEWAACQLSHPNIVRFIATLWLHDVMGSRFAVRLLSTPFPPLCPPLCALSTHAPLRSFIHPYICPSTSPSIYPHMRPSILSSIHPLIYPSFRVSICLAVHPFNHHLIYPNHLCSHS